MNDHFLATCLFFLSPILAFAVVAVSSRPSRGSYRVALGCHTVVAAVAAVQVMTRPVMDIVMQAASGTSVPRVMLPAMVALAGSAGFVYLVLCLYPFMPERYDRIGKGIAYYIAGVAVVYTTGTSAYGNAGAMPLAFLAVFHLMLWLRMYGLKRAVVRMTGGGGAAGTLLGHGEADLSRPKSGWPFFRKRGSDGEAPPESFLRRGRSWVTLPFAAYLLAIPCLGPGALFVPIVIGNAPLGVISYFDKVTMDDSGHPVAMTVIPLVFWGLMMVGFIGRRGLPLGVLRSIWICVVAMLFMSVSGCGVSFGPGLWNGGNWQ